MIDNSFSDLSPDTERTAYTRNVATEHPLDELAERVGPGKVIWYDPKTGKVKICQHPK